MHAWNEPWSNVCGRCAEEHPHKLKKKTISIALQLTDSNSLWILWVWESNWFASRLEPEMLENV